MRPDVIIGLSNGGLNIQPPSEFGTAVLIMATPAAPTAGYGVAFEIKSIGQAKAAFAAAGNADVLKAIIEAFYGEAPEGTKLFVVCLAQVTTMTAMAAAAVAELGLNKAGGQARLVAICKQPAAGYVPDVVEGFDGDVHTATAAMQALANTWLGKKMPFRFFIQGFAYTGVPADVKDYKTTAFRNGHIVVGNVGGNNAAGSLFATLLALGRAARIQPQQNIGRIKSGSLNINQTYMVRIGATEADKVSDADLNTLHEKRYITFEKNKIASGFVFNDDNSTTVETDDYNNLRNGRVIDNAVRVAHATYYNELKEDVEVDAGGRLAPVVEKALETQIETAIDQQMRSQLSKNAESSADVECLVNPDPFEFAALYTKNGIDNPKFNVFDGGNVYLFISLRPKGCLKRINIFLGFVA